MEKPIPMSMVAQRRQVLESDLPPSTRLVLLVLSCYVTDAGENCFPTLSTLAKNTGMVRENVETHLHIAKMHGFLVVDHRYKGRT